MVCDVGKPASLLILTASRDTGLGAGQERSDFSCDRI